MFEEKREIKSDETRSQGKETLDAGRLGCDTRKKRRCPDRNEGIDPNKKVRNEKNDDGKKFNTDESWIWTGGGSEPQTPGERMGKDCNLGNNNLDLKKGEKGVE